MNRWRLFLFFYFCINAVVFWFYLPESYMADKSYWSNQIEYVELRDPRALDFQKAYGHPGTTLVEFGSIIHRISGASYRLSLFAAISILTSLCSTAIVLLARTLRPRSRWWMLVIIILFFNRMYYASPPSMVALPALMLVILLTWFVTERHLTSPRWAALWGMVIAFSAATRLDSTALFALLSLGLCWNKLGWRWATTAVGLATISFVLLDPFFWYMPIQHLRDLLTKFTMHYSNFPDHGTLFNGGIRDYYFFAGLSIVASIWLFVKKRFDVIPRSVLWLLYIGTFLAIYVIATASYHVVRYFLPVMFLWDILLPLFLLTIIGEGIHKERAQHGEQRVSKKIVILFIVTLVTAWVFPNVFLMF